MDNLFVVMYAFDSYLTFLSRLFGEKFSYINEHERRQKTRYNNNGDTAVKVFPVFKIRTLQKRFSGIQDLHPKSVE